MFLDYVASIDNCVFCFILNKTNNAWKWKLQYCKMKNFQTIFFNTEHLQIFPVIMWGHNQILGWICSAHMAIGYKQSNGSLVSLCLWLIN